jgi:hypothetical protein
MERSPFSLQHYRHRKGIPDIPYKPRTFVSPDWTAEIVQLEKFFAGIVIPEEAIKLNAWTTIADVVGFIEAELLCSKANNGKRTFRSHIDRLFELKRILLSYKRGQTRKAEMQLRKNRLRKMRAKSRASKATTSRPIPIEDFLWI